jgi:tetratricopeptide (TPR) repeat protein
MGAVFLKQQKYQRAVEELSKVLATDAQSLKAYYRRGQAYLALKSYDKAKADFSKWKELSPGVEDKVCVPPFVGLPTNSFSVEAGLKRIAQWEKLEEEKTKKMYQNMFNGL